MMKEKILGFLLAALSLCPLTALADERILARIEQFLNVLESNPSYFVSQDYDFFEGEMTIVEKLCGDDLNLSDKERTLCVDLKNERFQDNRDTPSLLLLWLRTKFPKNPTVTVLKIEWEPRYSRHRITTKLNNMIAVFELYDIGPSHKPLVVRSINGETLYDVVDHDIKSGLSVSSLLKGTMK